MTAPTIPGNRMVLTEQLVVGALAKALGEIKQADDLTWNDMAAVLGKCPEQVAKYYEGSAKMDAVALYRARQAWGSRFTGYADRLCDNSQDRGDQQAQTSVLTAALALSVALEDGKITPHEIRQNRSTIEAARDALDGLLARLRPAA
jgi:hypothetical protein